MKLDDLLSEYSDKAAEQSRERGRQPRPQAQPRQRRKPQRVMKYDPASQKKIETRQELYEHIVNSNPDIRISSIRRKKG